MPNRGEFRASTDQFLAILDDIREHEKRKQTLSVGSSEFVDAATEVAQQTRLAFRWASMQLQMAHESAARVERGEQPPNVHLIEVEPRHIDRVLALWREAQLRLEIARPGSDEAAHAVDEIERLREEYQTLHAGVVEQSRDGT